MAESTDKRASMIASWCGLTLAAICAYLTAVFVVDEPYLGRWSGSLGWLVLSTIAFVLGYSLASRSLKRDVRTARLINVCLLGTVLVCGVLVVDIVSTVYFQSAVSTGQAGSSRSDRNVWVSELYPRRYYPTDRNFMLHKPGVSVSGSPYGTFYRNPMEDSPTLAASVLERFPITIHINDLGFRESTPIDSAEVFTLGDSFTFGWGVNESESWPGLLESATGAPVYNLAIHDASPRQELELLKYVLREQGDRVQIRELIWMIYEDNDLEDDYSELRPGDEAEPSGRPTDGTLIEAARNLPRILKRQSVIHGIRSGTITRKTGPGSRRPGAYSVDGIDLPHPLFYSETLGPRLFSSRYVQRAGNPLSYVLDHPHRPRLEAVFAEMESLAEEHGFAVTVVVAPGPARLHGPYYEDFPEVSTEPHFIDFVLQLSRSSGFEAVDLYRLMQPFAGDELLFFRDDDHFNHRGNALAAELIAETVLAQEN